MFLIDALRRQAQRLPLAELRRAADGGLGALPACRPETRLMAAAAAVLNNHPRPGLEADDRAAARDLVARLAIQALPDDPDHPAFGIYPRNLGDSPEAVHDKNWEGFVGTPLLRILQHDPRELADWPAADRELLARAIRLPALAAVRRDVRLGYTNVLAMSLYLLLGAGRLLDDADIRRAGEQKLARAMRFAATTQGFQEYNSPTYAGVVLPSLVSLAALEADGPLAEPTADLLDMFLRHLARHYHRPTGQLAGPHSRAYADTLLERSALPSFLYSAGVPPYDRLPEMAGEKGEVPGIALDLSYPAAVPGLALPGGLMAAFADDFARPRETSEAVEWVGRDTAMPAPRGELPRFHLITTYRDAAFSVGSHNEECIWSQRRNVLAHWLDDLGRLTGLKLDVELDCPHLADNFPCQPVEKWVPAQEKVSDTLSPKRETVSDTAVPHFSTGCYGIWPLEMGIESIAVQDGPCVLGGLIRADVVAARAGDRLAAPSAYMGIGHERLLVPRRPAAWLLGTHWRQPIEPEDLSFPVDRMDFRFTPIGRGQWRQEDADLFVFAAGEVSAMVRTGEGARLDGRGRLLLASLCDVRWDWLGGPEVLVPFFLRVGVGGQPSPPAVIAEEYENHILLMAGHLSVCRTRVTRPDLIEQPTWCGDVAGRRIEPA